MDTLGFWNVIMFNIIEVTSKEECNRPSPIFEPTLHIKLAFPGWFCWDPLLLDRAQFLSMVGKAFEVDALPICLARPSLPPLHTWS